MRGNSVPAWRSIFTGQHTVLTKTKRWRWSPWKMIRSRCNVPMVRKCFSNWVKATELIRLKVKDKNERAAKIRTLKGSVSTTNGNATNGNYSRDRHS